MAFSHALTPSRNGFENALRWESPHESRRKTAVWIQPSGATIPETFTAPCAKIVGQEEGVQAVVDLYQVFCARNVSPAGR